MPEKITLDHKPVNRYKGVIRLQDGEIIAHYKSIKEANKLTGINKGTISRACNGKRPMAGGYVWIFA
jgi:hypothetical protein